MDHERFDDFTRSLTRKSSRGQALKIAGVLAAGGLFGLSRASRASAGHKAGHDCFPVGHHCGNDKHCCLGYCDRETHRCAIPPGATLTLCGGCTSNNTCTDTSCICCFDPEHCSVYTGQCVKS